MAEKMRNYSSSEEYGKKCALRHAQVTAMQQVLNNLTSMNTWIPQFIESEAILEMLLDAAEKAAKNHG